MADPLRIRIRSDWDAALAYDSLDEKPDSRAVFVGRDTLIAPLVAEICEPNKRGTYLISGYRGTGKTTLLIEALSRAQEQLTARKHILFPVVLNVSEVSASLGGEPGTGMQLNIDPRRLLIALLRTIDHRIGRLVVEDSSLRQLAERAHYAYEKATAARFAQTATNAQETARIRSREFVVALEDKSVLKALALLSGVAAVSFEAAALAGPVLGWLHAAAISLGAIFAISLTASFKRSSSERLTAANQTAFEHDNSLHELETDLKDILVALKQHKLRTVVVMEELDKIDDPKGDQLAAVIRYFKNLFTQAPALFFFVTDKSYFDIIASAIKRARRGRSYAVEHTFFTHRVFVGRPSTEESLQYITAIISDEEDRAAITGVAETLGKPGRIEQAGPLGRFVRLVLFNAANHLFDLKNELRRFARNERDPVGDKNTSASHFLIDDQTLPPEEAALAVFQDLIVEKARSFEIKGGRTYANETLADSLYAVFNELGSNRPQNIDSFMPVSNADSVDGLLLDEQLDLNEAARVRDAVLSLVGDLERGRAFQPRDASLNTFTWRDDAARAFRYVRQLEKHEEGLIAELQRHTTLALGLTAGMQPETPHSLAATLEKRVGEVRDAQEPMTADAAAAEQRSVADRYSTALTDAFNSRLVELGQYGFVFQPIAHGLGGSLHLVRPNSGDPRLSASGPRGGVLLALGEFETLLDDVWSFVRPPAAQSIAPLNRVALVHVIHATGNTSTQIENRRQQWEQSWIQRGEGTGDFLHAVDVVALVGRSHDSTLNEVQRTAAALAGFGAWAQIEQRPYESIPGEMPDLSALLATWQKSDKPIFHMALPIPTGFRLLVERDVLETDGTAVVSLAGYAKVESVFASVALNCMLLGFQQVTGAADQRWTPLGRWLLTTRRVILYVDLQAMAEWSIEDVVEAMNVGAQVIIAMDGPLPPELKAFAFLASVPLKP
ncbi:MAG TPA: hypothetical protein VNP98_01750 [Chthoniobacterales bacterium]|nr:hypothetical protein [Chthoniobacterales bacterium]